MSNNPAFGISLAELFAKRIFIEAAKKYSDFSAEI